MSILSEFLSEADAAHELRLSPRTLKRWRALRKGPKWVRVGRGVFYRRAAIDHWLASQEEAAA